MSKTTQASIIEEAILTWMDKGLTDKTEIYSKIVEEFGVPRPTVRRCARDLRTSLEAKVKILTPDPPIIAKKITQTN